MQNTFPLVSLALCKLRFACDGTPAGEKYEPYVQSNVKLPPVLPLTFTFAVSAFTMPGISTIIAIMVLTIICFSFNFFNMLNFSPY